MDRQQQTQLADLAYELARKARKRNLVPPWYDVTLVTMIAAQAWLEETTEELQRKYEEG